MKRFFFYTTLLLCLIASATTTIAQETDSLTVQVSEVATETPVEMAQEQPQEAPKKAGFTQELKKRFIEGGPGFMGIVLLCLILGLAKCFFN